MTTTTAAVPLKILILSTPKTGNIWLRGLLAAAYDLPPVDLPVEFRPELFAGLGERWVAHQHWPPAPALMEWLEKNHVVVLTTTRHPGDVFVSLRHYVAQDPNAAQNDPVSYEMTKDGAVFGPATLRYLEAEFPWLVSLSILWMRMGATVVRFEDLTSDPVRVLTQLTHSILPVSPERIRHAVLLCELNRMRAAAVETKHHFRSGGTGGWRHALPAEFVATLRTREPFPTQLTTLGYDLAENSPKSARFDYKAMDPFRGETVFDNGARITPLMLRVYLMEIPDAATRWPDPLKTAPADSYFHWLNAPADAASPSRPDELIITNLAYQIYVSRMDLQQFYPDVFGRNRLELCKWFYYYGSREYELSHEFIAPVLRSIAESATPFRYRLGTWTGKPAGSG